MTSDKCLHPINVNGQEYNCGKCRYCRAKRQLNWTIRGKHEGLTNRKKIFITLTYNNDHLHKTAHRKEHAEDNLGSLRKKDLQDFFKRLRKHLKGRRIKYIASGEYSPEKWRPHYHAIIFGISNKDISQRKLEKIWKKGFVDLDPKQIVTSDAIAYTIGYINKKMQDDISFEHYQGNGREEPFQLTSQKLGLDWCNSHDWWLTMKTGMNEKEYSIPRYYIKKIYEAEGCKIRIDNTIIRARDINHTHTTLINLFDEIQIIDGRSIATTSHKTKYYKVFINPNGEKTKMILEHEHQMRLENIKKTAQKLKLSDKSVQKMTQKYLKEYAEKMMKYHQEWNDAKNLSEEKLKAKYQHTTVKFTNRWISRFESEIIPTGLNANQYQEVIRMAEKRNENIKQNLKKYDKRNSLEQQEEFDKFKAQF